MGTLYWFKADKHRTEIEMPVGYKLQDVWDKAKSLAQKWEVDFRTIEYGLVSVSPED